MTLSSGVRDKHLYITGGTGAGKSKLLERLIRQDIANWPKTRCGLLLIDPHGSVYDGLVRWLARANIDRPVIPIDLRRDDWVVSYNLLRRRAAKPSVVIDGFVEAMSFVWGQAGTNATPLFEQWASSLLRALYDTGRTLSEALQLLDRRDKSARLAVTAGVQDPLARRDWAYANDLSPEKFDLQIGSTLRRVARFVRNDQLRATFGQTGPSLDLGEALEEGHIILVSLARRYGLVSAPDARLFGTLLLADLWAAVQERRDKSRKPRPFYVYLDEFQRFVTPTMAENLAESRGYGLGLTLAHRLYATKVLDHREEVRKTRTLGAAHTSGGTRTAGATGGEGLSGKERADDRGEVNTTEIDGRLMEWNRFATTSSSDAEGWSDTESESETEQVLVMPILGQELASVQFRGLDEQLFRAMQRLFAQPDRHCAIRVVGERAPVFVKTLPVSEPPVSEERERVYIESRFRRWPFFLPMTEAIQRLASRQAALLSVANGEEAATAKRRKPRM